MEQFILYEKFGNVYSNLDQKKKAISYYKAALLLQHKHTCVSPSLYYEILFRIGDTYKQISQKDSADFFYFKAANFLEVKDAQVYRTFLNHRNAGDSLVERKLYSEALIKYKQAITSGQKMTGNPEHKYLAPVFYKIAIYSITTENISQATKAATKAVTIFHKEGGETDSNYLKSLKVLANCYHLSGDQEKSDALLQEYTRIKLALGED